MSYEGYVQAICKNGHYFQFDAYNTEPHCFVCNEQETIWTNGVDETNCDSSGIIPAVIMNTFIIEPEVKETCNLGHIHITKHAVYRAPTKEETKKSQHYRDNKTDKLVPSEPAHDVSCSCNVCKGEGL